MGLPPPSFLERSANFLTLPAARRMIGVRLAVRGALWPVVGWARLALAAPTMAFGLLGGGVLALALLLCVVHRGWRSRGPDRGRS